ncbi:MAG: helix-hairpin-helix domain-containing protein [Dehalococcoidia bacterium]|nr:helix-hairpin-helix domain-containing protein [Dehalococcoidia bacterium]
MVEIAGRLETLVGGADFDVTGFDAGRAAACAGSLTRFIHHAAVPGKQSVPLFKVLLTNACMNDCAYCANRAGRDCRRYSFQPDELAKLFMDLHSKKLVKGLFLTSGVAENTARTQETMIRTVEILREKHGFRGYVHLKILPGAPFDCVEEACRIASRVSLNMEAPTAAHLARLSAIKDLYHGIVERMRWIKDLADGGRGLVPAGQTTQFVAGAAGESDRDILRTTGALYRELDLKRVYFSAFRPVRQTPLEGLGPASPGREHRLYQADWLLRVYGFSLQEVELAAGDRGNLSLSKDPKLVIAAKQPWLYPVDINRASYPELLRVPGIGPISARRIIEARGEHSIFSLNQLRKMRVVIRQSAPYIWFQGMEEHEKQASFLPELERVVSPRPASLAALCGGQG